MFFVMFVNYVWQNQINSAILISLFITSGGVAQLGEHHVRNVGVKGSNPSVSSNQEA